MIETDPPAHVEAAEEREGEGAVSAPVMSNDKKRNKHIGSSLDDFLKEEGILEQTRAAVHKETLAWQVRQAVGKEKISKAEMARRVIPTTDSLPGNSQHARRGHSFPAQKHNNPGVKRRWGCCELLIETVGVSR